MFDKVKSSRREKFRHTVGNDFAPALSKVPHHNIFVAVVGDPDPSGNKDKNPSQKQKNSRTPIQYGTAADRHKEPLFQRLIKAPQPSGITSPARALPFQSKTSAPGTVRGA